ncbi:MAG: ABC transporter permease [Treponema sp.]|nr:ABC transporter permease [Treponema sp.]
MDKARRVPDEACEEDRESALRKTLGAIGRFFASFFEGLRRLGASPAAMISLLILAFWFLMAIFGPLIAPYSPSHQSIAERFQGPGLHHFFGTDRFGRDVFSRVVIGSHTVFLLAASSTLLSLVVGTVVGLVSGYIGGVVDELIMRFTDILMSFPMLLFAMLMLGIMGPSFVGVVVVIAIVFFPRIARVVRSDVLDLKTKEFVEAAKVRGENAFYIMFVEILPNTLGPLGVEAAVRFGYAIFTSASLGFLGLGVQPPTPDWGLMMNDAQAYITTAPWMAVFPALAIASLTVAVNFLADAIRKLGNGDL